MRPAEEFREIAIVAGREPSLCDEIQPKHNSKLCGVSSRQLPFFLLWRLAPIAVRTPARLQFVPLTAAALLPLRHRSLSR